MNDTVFALAVGPDGQVYAGGYFTIAGGVVASRVARWDGSQWHPLYAGSGMNDTVFALAVGPDGQVYAGGDFTTAGGVAANYIARWDGATSSWHPLGSGMNGPVYALAFGPDGSLYAGGDSQSAGGVAANYIARWDLATSSWQPLGSGLNGGVGALAFGPDGSLYAGGEFTTAGGVTANCIARWDPATASWHPLGSGMEGDYPSSFVADLAFGPDGSLYAGGHFWTAGGVIVRNIARWDGSQWHPLGSGMGGGDYPEVPALAFGPDGSLYVGGGFTTAGGVPARYIARWDPATSSWHPLGSGMGGCSYCWVLALAFGPDGSLYAGGGFDTAGGKPSSHFALWTGAVVSISVIWFPVALIDQ
jgi:WD40 repeat protein